MIPLMLTEYGDNLDRRVWDNTLYAVDNKIFLDNYHNNCRFFINRAMTDFFHYSGNDFNILK